MKLDMKSFKPILFNKFVETRESLVPTAETNRNTIWSEKFDREQRVFLILSAFPFELKHKSIYGTISKVGAVFMEAIVSRVIVI